MEYPVSCKGTEIGKATVTRQGLYYEIRCTCHLTDGRMHRLVVSCGNRTADLGILVPVKEGFGLQTRIPLRKLGEGALRFSISDREKENRTFVPIRTDEPFPLLPTLRMAVLEIRDGVLGASIPKE